MDLLPLTYLLACGMASPSSLRPGRRTYYPALLASSILFMCSYGGMLVSRFPLIDPWLVEKIPTFVLGISTLFPRIRNNTLFAVCFFMTRIVFHIVLGISFLFEENRKAVTGGSYIPALLLVCIFPFHVTWFVGCIKGFILRARRKTTPVSVSLTKSVALGPSPAPSSVPFILPAHLRRFSHRRSTFERALQSFQYDSRESPASKSMTISHVVFTYMPRRETLYEWVGLGQKQRRRTMTGG